MSHLDQRDDRQQARRDQVWARLETVIDPELDESVTELNFVTQVEVSERNRVQIGFRLPTYWCAANFSFLMADDMRRAVAAIDWVEGVEVTLGEHMYADKINAGLAQGLSFQETFGDEADGDIEDVRRTFLVKAFQRRQYAILSYLTGAGHAPEALVAMTIAELERLALDVEGGRLRRRYLDRRGVIGPMSPGAYAFVSPEGVKLNGEGLARYLSELRRVGVNAEFNGALCRGLLAVRFDLETPLKPRARAAPTSTAA
jgi:metal-sulfur cluster biosynthetic enzyme